MECNELTKQRQTYRQRKDRQLSEGKGVVWLGGKDEGIQQKRKRKKKKNPHRHRQQNDDYQREKRVVGGRGGGINGDRRRLDLG